jgi:hypothetical protein
MMEKTSNLMMNGQLSIQEGGEVVLGNAVVLKVFLTKVLHHSKKQFQNLIYIKLGEVPDPSWVQAPPPLSIVT